MSDYQPAGKSLIEHQLIESNNPLVVANEVQGVLSRSYGFKLKKELGYGASEFQSPTGNVNVVVRTAPEGVNVFTYGNKDNSAAVSIAYNVCDRLIDAPLNREFNSDTKESTIERDRESLSELLTDKAGKLRERGTDLTSRVGDYVSDISRKGRDLTSRVGNYTRDLQDGYKKGLDEMNKEAQEDIDKLSAAIANYAKSGFNGLVSTGRSAANKMGGAKAAIGKFFLRWGANLYVGARMCVDMSYEKRVPRKILELNGIDPEEYANTVGAELEKPVDTFEPIANDISIYTPPN